MKIVYHQLGAGTLQQIQLPNNSRILSVQLVRKVPTLVVLESTATASQEITIGMYRELQTIAPGAMDYIGSLDVNNDGKLFHFIQH